MANRDIAEAKMKVVNDGIKNPGGIALGGFAAAYLGFIPVTSWLANRSALTSLVNGTVGLLPGYTSSSGRVIPALSALYIFWTFGASGALSVAAQAMGRKEGLDNDHPRKHINELEGLPLRMRSAHYGLLENFPAYALAAALAQMLAPNNMEILNLLGLHVLAKLFMFYPAYLMGLQGPRAVGHIAANAAMINVCWRLATGSA